MAGPVWGTAEIQITADGTILPAQIRRIATTAGREAGDNFNRQFNNRLNRNRGFVGLFRNLGGVIRNLGRVFAGLGRAVTGSMDLLLSAGKGLSESWSGLSQSFQSLSHNSRQWVLIIALIVAALPPAIALIQTLTGVILLLVTSLTAAVVGIGILVTAFIGLYAEGAKLTEAAQSAKDAFGILGDTFTTLRDTITNAVFAEITDSIGALNGAIQALSPAIESFATLAGQQLGSIFDALSSSTAVDTFAALLKGFEPIFASLTQAGISFVQGFGNFLIASLPAATIFADMIAQAAAAFAEWSGSVAGRAEIQAFLDRALTLLPPLLDAVFDLANAFGNLVSPAVVTDTANLLTNLTEGLQFIFDIVQIIGGLDLFGNIIAAFQSISALLGPLTPGLTAVATAIGDLLYSALQAIIPLFAGVGAALGPLMDVIGALAGQLATMLMPLFTALGAIFQELMPLWIAIGEVIGEVAQVLMDALIPILDPLIELFIQVAVALVPLVEDLMPILITLIQGSALAFQFLAPIIVMVANVVGAILGQAVQIVVGILTVAITIIGNVANALNSVLAPAVKFVQGVVKEFGNFFRDAWASAETAVRQFGSTVSGVFNTVIGAIRTAMDWVGRLVSAIGRLDFGAIGSLFGGGGGGFASGGVLLGPRRILAGEAGPEAIVPLNRALSQVDPSVRWLSAIAQNKSTPAMAGGGMVGGGRIINVEPGAIQVIGAQDPRRTAIEVVDRIVERTVA
jgi:phage-related protein